MNPVQRAVAFLLVLAAGGVGAVGASHLWGHGTQSRELLAVVSAQDPSGDGLVPGVGTQWDGLVTSAVELGLAVDRVEVSTMPLSTHLGTASWTVSLTGTDQSGHVGLVRLVDQYTSTLPDSSGLFLPRVTAVTWDEDSALVQLTTTYLR